MENDINNIQITSQGVRRSLSKFTEIESIIEYIWNGFDAKATLITIDMTFNTLGSISEIKIKDNGVGIDRNRLSEKFKPFFQSEKIEQQIQEKKKQNSALISSSSSVPLIGEKMELNITVVPQESFVTSN